MSLAEVLQLPLHEKLQIMEIIWEDLRARAEQTEISKQTKDLLNERRQRVELGDAPLLAWDDVKNTIGEGVR